MIKKIKSGLNHCVGGRGCNHKCPYYNVSKDPSVCQNALLRDINTYLKETKTEAQNDD